MSRIKIWVTGLYRFLKRGPIANNLYDEEIYRRISGE